MTQSTIALSTSAWTRSAAGRLRRASRRPREQSRQQSVPSEQTGPCARLAACARLHASVRVQQPGRSDGALAVFTENAAQPRECSWTDEAIRVEQPHSSARPTVSTAWLTAAPKPTIRGLRTSVTPGTDSIQAVAAIARRVVHDDDLGRDAREFGRQPIRRRRGDGAPALKLTMTTATSGPCSPRTGRPPDVQRELNGIPRPSRVRSVPTNTVAACRAIVSRARRRRIG